jgi:hypothetical protein
MLILGEKNLFLGVGLFWGACLFWERKAYFWSARHMWWKNNMQKMKEKKHAEDVGKTVWRTCRQT